MARLVLRSFAISVVMMISTAGIARPSTEVSVLPIRTASSETRGGSQVVVAKGDHLWRISATHLEAVLDRAVKTPEISPYWRDVIAVNRATLKSGDPDLIYPGEIVVLPERASEKP